MPNRSRKNGSRKSQSPEGEQLSSLSSTYGIVKKINSIFSKQATPLLKSQVFSPCSNYLLSIRGRFLEQILSNNSQIVTTQGLLSLLTTMNDEEQKVES